MTIQNARTGRASEAAKHLARRIPLTVRTLELLAVVALYVAGVVFVDHLTGQAHFPVAVAAMFLLPIVLSVGLRWVRTVERRVRHVTHHDLPHVG